MKQYTCMFATLLAVACASSERQPNEIREIRATSEAVLATIEKKDIKAFRELVGVPLEQIGQSEATLARKFDRICRVYEEYAPNERPPVFVTDSVSTYNKRVVFIPIYSGKGLKGSVGQVRLMLLFGPKSHYPYNKISDIELHVFNHEMNELPLPDAELPSP
ncbi:hypothetical protein [Chitinophaga caseinilytica]|uniref:DUF3887 domain-containing protein n=1 Tax=Chitinophaga caseinilytica TaxID=2267521 RepID=A0ABZ2YZB5_9BACT